MHAQKGISRIIIFGAEIQLFIVTPVKLYSATNKREKATTAAKRLLLHLTTGLTN